MPTRAELDSCADTARPYISATHEDVTVRFRSPVPRHTKCHTDSLPHTQRGTVAMPAGLRCLELQDDGQPPERHSWRGRGREGGNGAGDGERDRWGEEGGREGSEAAASSLIVASEPALASPGFPD